MKVLIERLEDVVNEVLTEGTERRYIVEGVCIQTNVKNRNQRIYPKGVVKPEVDRYIREELARGEAVGELNHPTDDPRINYERVSHKFEKLTESGDNWIGRAVITKKTPMGAIVAGLMDEGVRMGISSRGLGDTKLSEGVKVVQRYRLISPGDILSDPSAPDAYLTNLMEGKEWVFANGVLVEQVVDQAKDSLNNLAARKQLNPETMKQMFEHILSKI